jgi:uncharacterized protein (TIGR02266 family)
MPDERKPTGGTDRRVHPRLSMALELDVRSGHNFYSGRTRDISVGGLFIETNIALAIGTPLTVDLTLMKKHLQLDVEIVWSLVGDGEEPAGVGVTFVNLPPTAKKSIESFMALREPMVCEMLASDDDEQEATSSAAKPPSDVMTPTT